MANSCYRIREEKTFTTSVSCETDPSSCCYLDRIFTLDTSDTSLLQQCSTSWEKCFSGAAALRSGSLSATEQIWVIVCSVLVFIVLLIIFFFLYRLLRQKQEREMKSRSVGTEDAGDMVVDVEAEACPGKVEATQIFVTNVPVKTSSRDTGDLKDKIDKLIRSHDAEKLEALLDTISDLYSDEVDQEPVKHAREVLDAWRAETLLQEFCNTLDPSSPEHLSTIQGVVQQTEASPQQDHIHSLIVKHAKHKLSTELDRQNMIQELKVKVNEAMIKNDLEELEALVDLIRAKQLDREFERELWYAQNQFQGEGEAGVVVVQKDLASAVGARDLGHLRRAVERVEDSKFKGDLATELHQAKQTIGELEEIRKMRNLHKLKIKNAAKSQDIERMEDTLRSAKLDGFGEDLRPELNELELLLKRRYLQKRLKGNINVAIQSLDLVRLRRAIEEATTAGFIQELGLELDEARAQGLLSKLERIELIKRAVMELTNSHIAEIKSYTAPPIEVHKVLMALLIVLGEEPEVVRDWFEIQVLLVKTGRLSLRRRVQEYNPGNLATGNARRAANILNDIKREDLHSISRAAKVFYLWTTAVVEDRLSLDIIQ